jgi:hypothetical protein
MKKFRLKKTFDGYAIQNKFLFFWIDSETDYDSHTIYYREYSVAKNKLEILTKIAERDQERKLQRIEDAKLRKNFVTAYLYPPLPDEEPSDRH